MNRYHDTVTEEATKLFNQCAESFQKDAGEHGGASNRPNLALWLDRTGILSKHLEALTKSWTMKDYLWVNEHTRHRVAFGDPKDNAFGAFYKDILLELKKLMRKA
jgi:hypothetical protein